MITNNIQVIKTKIRNNEIVSIPTDTVYGLSSKLSKYAVKKIINLKKRDYRKGLIIISHNYNHLLQYVNIEKLTLKNIKKISTKQENATTWIVPSKDNIRWLTGNNSTIAIRLVETDIVNQICSDIDDAIISTSANISGEYFINNPENISKTFSNIYVLKTTVKSSRPSIIIDIMTNQRLR